MEIHKQTGILTGLNNNIDREGIHGDVFKGHRFITAFTRIFRTFRQGCFFGFGTFDGGDRICGSIIINMIEGQVTVAKLIIQSQGQVHRFFRLEVIPLNAVFVVREAQVHRYSVFDHFAFFNDRFSQGDRIAIVAANDEVRTIRESTFRGFDLDIDIAAFGFECFGLHFSKVRGVSYLYRLCVHFG